MKEIKTNAAMAELRLYMVNDEFIYKSYMEIVREIVVDKKPTNGRNMRRMIELTRDAVGMYKNQFGESVGRIGKNQIAWVAREILLDEVKEAKKFYEKHHAL